MFNKKSLFMKKYLNIFSFQMIVIITTKLDMKINLQFLCRTHIYSIITERKRTRNRQSDEPFALNKEN